MAPPSSFRAGAILSGFASLLLVVTAPTGATAEARVLFTHASSYTANSYAAKRTHDRRFERIKRRTTIESADLISVDTELLRRCSTRDGYPNERKLTFHHGRLDCSHGSFRLGLLSGDGQATFVIHQGRVTGTVVRGDETFRVEPAHGMHVLVKIAPELFPKEDAEPRLREGDSTAPPLVGGGPTPTSTEIDVLVAYTPSAANMTTDMHGLIHKAVQDANDSYANSDIRIRLNLVDSFQLPYYEGAKTFEEIVQDFAQSTTVNSRRDRSGADVSVLIVNGPGSCRPPSPANPQPGDLNCCGLGDALMAKDSTAFSVVHYECALGPNYSFAHEIGHLQGATHDRDGTLPAFRPYGHGFQHLSRASGWRTIMAYDCNPHCPRRQFWSNPRIKYNGVATGTTGVNDNARLLNETAATVAGFRNRPPGRQPMVP